MDIDDITYLSVAALSQAERNLLRLKLERAIEDIERYEASPEALAVADRDQADHPLTGVTLQQVVARVDQYESVLAAPESPIHDSEIHRKIYWAFNRASVGQLTQAREVCVRLLRHLDQQHRLNLIRRGGKYQDFWFGVLKDTADLS